MLNRTSSHICGRWYLPMFLFRDGLLTLMYRTSFIALLRFWSSLPTMLKLSILMLWPVVLKWSNMGKPEIWESLGWYQAKACPQLQILVLFLRKIEFTLCQTEWETFICKYQPDLKPYPGGTSDQISTWPQVWPNVNMTPSFILGCTSDQLSTWPKVWSNVTWPKASSRGEHLTKCQPDPKCDQMSTWP